MVTKDFGPLFLVLSSLTNHEKQFLEFSGFNWYSNHFCGSYNTVSLGHKMLLETQFFEKVKANFPVKKSF